MKTEAKAKVDVTTTTVIDRPIAAVAHFASDPDNAPRWYENIVSVTWETPRPLARGSRFVFVASFLGKRLEYTYEVAELVPLERMVMRMTEGPFPMETTYIWERVSTTSTRMTLRNRGSPSGFSKLAGPLMSRAIRKANEKDLESLKGLLEK
jgi:uncharacterized membrane protein